MFNTYLPFNIKENTDANEILMTLRRVGAKYAILSFDDVIMSCKRERYEKKFEMIADLVPILKSHGYGVGIYFWSLWLTDMENDELVGEVMLSSSGKPRIRQTALNSNEPQLSGFLCPASSKMQTMLDIIEAAARSAPDLILLNDDLGYATYLGSIGCYCDRHMALMRRHLGRDISREELRDLVSSGKRSEARDAWLALQGEVIESYACAVRRTIDAVDPTIRCGFCAVMSNWETDGISVERITKLLAGGTKPILRTIGAPYWARGKAWGNRLHHTVELTRMESAWIEDGEIELIAEGDVYPRPRHAVPAAFLENYDTALRASGCCDGIFKIMLDYTSSLGYESGYLKRHVKNMGLYSEIERIFGDKSCTGVRVYERMNKAADADLTGIESPEQYAANLFFSHAARFLTDNSVPTVYTGGCGVGIAFGENARDLPREALDGGLILDVRAARILMEQGVDVGLESIGERMLNNYLYFPNENERTLTGYRGASTYEIRPRSGARVVTYSINKSEKRPDAIEYENVDGQRFLVYAFDAAFTDETRYRNYAVQRQLFASLEWLGGQKMPVACLGNPDLYVICKENSDELAVGLWNMFEDEILEPEIKLAGEYSAAEFVNCDGTLDRDTVRLAPIPAYGYAFIRLKK